MQPWDACRRRSCLGHAGQQGSRRAALTGMWPCSSCFLLCHLHSVQVYITKQVSFRNRVLILFDWLKARVFGRYALFFRLLLWKLDASMAIATLT
jgi:hypothetical protein